MLIVFSIRSGIAVISCIYSLQTFSLQGEICSHLYNLTCPPCNQDFRVFVHHSFFSSLYPAGILLTEGRKAGATQQYRVHQPLQRNLHQTGNLLPIGPVSAPRLNLDYLAVKVLVSVGSFSSLDW